MIEIKDILKLVTMNPQKEDTTQLLADGHTFNIPFYQRAYVWNEKLWSRFLRDMEYVSNTKEDYFIGSVILKKVSKEDEEVTRWSVVDGQQRLTTLAIFYKVLSLKDKTLHNPFDKRFRLDSGELTIRHSLADKEAFEEVANLEEDVAIDTAGSKLKEAYNYFQGHVDPSKVNLNLIQHRLMFIAIYLSAKENEHKIFDTINSLGMSLNTEELLKNYLYTEGDLDEYTSHWKKVFEDNNNVISYWKDETSVGSTGKKTLSDRFFHTLLQIIIHDPRNNISGSDRAEFRKYDDENEFSNFQKVIESGKWDKIDFAREICSYAELFRKIYSKKSVLESTVSTESPLGRILLVVFTLDVYTAVPYILYLLKNQGDESERNRIFTLLESYIVRRLICNKVSKNYSDLFTENLIGQQVLTYNGLLGYLAAKKPYESLHMPYDTEVEDGFATNATIAASKARGILYLLESKMRKMDKSQTVLMPYCNYSLEHLMPQKWEANWPIPQSVQEAEIFEFKENRKKALSTLGNMAIITQGLNSSISNSKWKLKLELGLKEKAGDLLTMKDVVNKSKWDESAILDRASFLAEKANQIWINVVSSGEKEEEEMQNAKIARDATLYSLNDGKFKSKAEFTHDAVKAFVEKHNDFTYNQIKAVFNNKVIDVGFKCIGFLCTDDEIANKTLANGRRPTGKELGRWYHSDKADAWIVSGDGIRFVVSTQLTKYSVEKVRKIMEKDGFSVKTKE